MKLKAMTRAAALTVGIALCGLGIATPASAWINCGKTCTVDAKQSIGITKINPGRYEAQAVNKDGRDSWIWVWTSRQGDHVDYYLDGDPAMHKLYAQDRSSASRWLNKKVTQLRVCGPNGIGGDVCSDWGHVDH
jgi:hypothetical protein